VVVVVVVVVVVASDPACLHPSLGHKAVHSNSPSVITHWAASITPRYDVKMRDGEKTETEVPCRNVNLYCPGIFHRRCWWNPAFDAGKALSNEYILKNRKQLHACPLCRLELLLIADGPQYSPPEIVRVHQRSVRRIKGDGHCMYRAIVRGCALLDDKNRGGSLSYADESSKMVAMRQWVGVALRENKEMKLPNTWSLRSMVLSDTTQVDLFGALDQCGDARDPFVEYCRRSMSRAYGGEAELTLLPRLIKRPIAVYTKLRHTERLHLLGTYQPPEPADRQRDAVEVEWQKGSGLGNQHYDLILPASAAVRADEAAKAEKETAAAVAAAAAAAATAALASKQPAGRQAPRKGGKGGKGGKGSKAPVGSGNARGGGSRGPQGRKAPRLEGVMRLKELTAADRGRVRAFLERCKAAAEGEAAEA